MLQPPRPVRARQKVSAFAASVEEQGSARVCVDAWEQLQFGEGLAAARALGPVVHAVALDFAATENLKAMRVRTSSQQNVATMRCFKEEMMEWDLLGALLVERVAAASLVRTLPQ
eukprot:438385-Rhodomonas_salina.1